MNITFTRGRVRQRKGTDLIILFLAGSVVWACLRDLEERRRIRAFRLREEFRSFQRGNQVQSPSCY
jgi:hypothetical protein